MYSCTLSLTSALDWAGGQRHDWAALPPRTKRYSLWRRLSWSQGHSRWVRNISPPPVFHSRTVQPVASRSNDWAIPTHRFPQTLLNFLHSTRRHVLDDNNLHDDWLENSNKKKLMPDL